MSRAVKVLGLVVFYTAIGWVVFAGYSQQLFPILTAVAAFLAWVFVSLYGLRSPWAKTVVGRSLMYVWLALTAVLTLIFFSYWLGDYTGRDYVRAVVYSTLVPAFLSFVSVLVQQQAKRDTGEGPADVDTDL